MFIIYNLGGLLIGGLGVMLGALLTAGTGSVGAGVLLIALVWLVLGFKWRRWKTPPGELRSYPSVFFIPLPFLAVPIIPLAVLFLVIDVKEGGLANGPGGARAAKDPRAVSFQEDEKSLGGSAVGGDVDLSQHLATALAENLKAEAEAEKYHVFTRINPAGVLVLVKAPNLRSYKEPARVQLLKVIANLVSQRDDLKEKKVYIGIKGNLAFGAIRVFPDRVLTGSVLGEETLYDFYGPAPDTPADASPASISGTGPPPPPPTSDPAPSPPAPTSEAIVTLTPRCAAQLHQLMQQNDQRKVLFIGASVAPGGSLVQYAMEFRESPPTEQVILTSSEKIPLAIDSEDAAFLKGTTLDYLADPGGFKFNNPREDKSLLREYREFAEEAARLRPIEEAKAKKVDPAKAVAELLTARRQEAFDDLKLWWKFHQPEADPDSDEVGRVDRYQQADGQMITVVFTGDPEKQNGGVYLIKADGRQIPFSSNYIDEDDQVVDVNGDNIPEIVVSDTMGQEDDDDPKKIVRDATNLEIFPISSDPRPLLSIVFDVRPVKVEPTWRWSLADKPSGSRDVVLEQQTTGEWKERARFVWSRAKRQYEGPGGSNDEGFLASPGKLAVDQIEAFMKRPKGK